MSALRSNGLDDLVQQKICAAIREGQTRKVAAELAGVSWSSLKNWVARGREPGADAKYVAFLAAVQKADAEAEAVMVETVRTHAVTTWQAAAWWLERRRQKTYVVRKERPLDHGLIGSPEWQRMSPAKKREMLDRARAKFAEVEAEVAAELAATPVATQAKKLGAP